MLGLVTYSKSVLVLRLVPHALGHSKKNEPGASGVEQAVWMEKGCGECVEMWDAHKLKWGLYNFLGI